MKRTALFKTGMITTALVLTLTFMTALIAAVSTDKAYADVASKGYKYKITVYAGKQGEFNGGKKIWSKEVDAGESVTISEETTGFRLTNKEYYVRGFRESGHDNDEQLKSVTFTADEDTSFEVAYGIAGGMVKYQVQYVDEDGDELRDSDTYYGMIGDKPVVSYKYVNNYMPQAYHVTKTLSKNEDKNVFTFKYRSTSGQGGDNNNQITNPGRDGVNNGQNAAAQAGNPAVNTDDGIANIDDQDGPLAPGNGNDTDNGNSNSNIDDSKTPQANSGAGKVNPAIIALIGGTAGLIAVFAAAAALMMKNRRKSEEA